MINIYPCIIRARGKRTILMWVNGTTGEAKDYLLKTSQGKIAAGRNRNDILNKIKFRRGDKIHWDESATYDFEKFQSQVRRLKKGHFSTISTCNEILNFWNFLGDLTYTIDASKNLSMNEKKLNGIYNKLFFGTNILSPEGKEYNPVWKERELKHFKSAVREAIDYIRIAAPEVGL